MQGADENLKACEKGQNREEEEVTLAIEVYK